MISPSVKRLQRWAGRLALVLVILAVASVTGLQVRRVYRERLYSPLIEEVAARQGVGDDFKYLVKAVIRRESRFDTTAAGAAGEIGLMQVTPGAAEDWALATRRADFQPDQLWNPRINLEAGAWYLARALRRWEEVDDPIPFALAEYNAGYGNVRRWLPPDHTPTAAEFVERITYPGVRDYIAVVQRHYARYRERGRL